MEEKSDNEIGTIIKLHLKSVYNFVFRLSKNKDEASDITQEVFIKVWKNLKKFNPDKNFKTWILTIARNTTIDWLRKKRSVVFSRIDFQNSENGNEPAGEFKETIVDIEPLPDEIFIKKELEKEVEEALSKIRPDFREIILLHHTEDLTFEEIGKVVGKSPNTVKSQYRRALNILRKLLIE